MQFDLVLRYALNWGDLPTLRMLQALVDADGHALPHDQLVQRGRCWPFRARRAVRSLVRDGWVTDQGSDYRMPEDRVEEARELTRLTRQYLGEWVA